MKIFYLILSLPVMAFAFTPTSQQDCTPLDLRNGTLNAVRDQKEVSWCYAFTGADMLAHTFDVSEKISAADMAIGYNQTRVGLFVRWLDLNLLKRKDPEIRRKAHQNGLNKISLNKAMQDGWCPERIFPSEAWTKMSRHQNDWKESQVPLAQAMLEIAALHDIRSSLSAKDIPYYYSFKNVDADSFVQLLQNKNVASFYTSLRNTVCQDDRQPFDHKWKVKMVFKNPNIFSRISKQLEDGRLVGLDYDARILLDSTHRGFKLSELHTSSLVARRWNPNQHTCEYLVRNSHGEDCRILYDESYECDAGNAWLGESLIYPSMTSIVYMLSGHAKDI